MSDNFSVVYCSVLLKFFLVSCMKSDKYAYNFEQLVTIFESLVVFCQVYESVPIYDAIVQA